MRVLVVEDEVGLAKLVRQGLRTEGMLADVAITGEDALWMAEAAPYDAICLDVNLPGIDGFETCRRLRTGGVATPILMLTAREDVTDRIRGLDTGADDYLVKPFDFGELVARIRALQRRPRGVDAPVIHRGDLALDPVKREVTVREKPLALTTTEYNILELLMRRSPAVVDRKAIAEHAWRDETDPLGSNAIDVQMSRLRAKLPAARVKVVTVRGAGYRLEEA